MPLRQDFDADDLRRSARESRDAGQSRRRRAPAAIYDGASRTDAARIGAVSLQTVRDWATAFNAQEAAGLIDRKAPGDPPKLDAAQRQALAQAIEAGPDLDRDGVVRWRLKDLGAICPEKGKGAGLVLPRGDSEAMNLHLVEIARSVAPPAHAVLIFDGAGWHGASDLVVPDSITLLTLPLHAPDLNPVENVRQFLRENGLGDRIFTSYDDILDRCCDAWNKLGAQPWIIMSLGLRQWVYRL